MRKLHIEYNLKNYFSTFKVFTVPLYIWSALDFEYTQNMVITVFMFWFSWFVEISNLCWKLLNTHPVVDSYYKGNCGVMRYSSDRQSWSSDVTFITECAFPQYINI